jgi:hypothetical protein
MEALAKQRKGRIGYCCSWIPFTNYDNFGPRVESLVQFAPPATAGGTSQDRTLYFALCKLHQRQKRVSLKTDARADLLRGFEE